MAQQVAIAKAALSASLFRADPTSLTRPLVEALFPLLDITLRCCSRPNVQECKVWIIDNIAPSCKRATSLGEYLGALSRSLVSEEKKPSLKRRRLHVLYIINDVLHHQFVKQSDPTFATSIEAVLPDLIASTASFEKCPKHMRKVEDLILLWESQKYFAKSIITKLLNVLASGAAECNLAATVVASRSLKPTKDAPWVLPSLHGDPASPWYDLPASTWLPHIIPNSTKPINPNLIKPIQLKSGPADLNLVEAVKVLLADADRIYSKEKPPVDVPRTDFNELGERITPDELTGDSVGGETYYGWSRNFCEKIKERRRWAKSSAESRGRSRSRSSSSRSRSQTSSGPPALKRRRQDSYSRSSSQERRQHNSSPSRSRSRSLNRSFSPSPPRGLGPSPQRHIDVPPLPLPPNLVPPPPPPPIGYQGQWPPPPLPLPHMGGSQNWFSGIGPQMMGDNWAGGLHPRPSPPPPPQFGVGSYYENYRDGHGGHRGQGYRGRGRGGYRGW